jgi:hypothetical protein
MRIEVHDFIRSAGPLPLRRRGAQKGAGQLFRARLSPLAGAAFGFRAIARA